MTSTLPRVATLALCAALALPAARAAEPTGVLKRIKDNGQITLGYRESSIPFSYLDDKAEPVGYSMELCGRIVEALKAELGLPALKVARQAVTSQNRIPLVANGTVDLECGSTVNNPERQQQVGFSVTTFVVATRFIARKAGNYRTLDDLRGKTVVVTTGTNTLKRVRDLNLQRKLEMNVVFGKDHADSMLLMTSGRAEAFFEDDILLTGMAAASATPNDFALGTEGLSVDPYALMFAKGDAPMKKLVDGTITALYRSGEIQKIYDRWFMKPIPPKGITLNFPAGALLKSVFARPTDSADPADYR